MTDQDFSLSEPAVLAVARDKPGVEELYEAGLGDRLQRLLQHLDQNLGLDAYGRRMAHETVVDILERRARLFADRERYPDLTKEEIRQPLIVTGQARSGTTLLHSLIAADPNSQSPAWWDSMRPSPPPGISPADDPRIEQMNREMAELVRLQPNLLQSHPYFDQGAHALMECEKLCMLDFRYVFRSTFYRVPAYVSMSLDADPVEFYQFHRMVLQALQWRRPSRRWALKGTEHHANLPALKTVYPDAIVIWIHRDPLKVVPSVLEMLASLSEGVSGKPADRPAFGRQVLRRYQTTLETAMASPMIDHPDVYHMRYIDFAANPVGSVEAVYRRYGLPFPADTAAAMQAWCDAPQNRGDRYGKFQYSLAAFDLTPADIEASMAPYRARFDIPYEGQRP